jgi:thiamine monophosphate kinase
MQGAAPKGLTISIETPERSEKQVVHFAGFQRKLLNLCISRLTGLDLVKETIVV